MFGLYAEVLNALEQSGLGQIARHSPVAFTTANVLHVLGAALLVGAIAVFDVSLIARRFEDAARVGRIALPLAATGLAVQVPTGLVLLSAEARALGMNRAFLIKLAFIALGLANVGLFHARFGAALREGVAHGGARTLAFVSLAAWVGTLAAGRVIAYV